MGEEGRVTEQGKVTFLDALHSFSSLDWVMVSLNVQYIIKQMDNLNK